MYKPYAQEIVIEEDEKSYYWLGVFCTNCTLKKSLAFRKGDLVNMHACPDCGNTTLIKK